LAYHLGDRKGWRVWRLAFPFFPLLLFSPSFLFPFPNRPFPNRSSKRPSFFRPLPLPFPPTFQHSALSHRFIPFPPLHPLSHPLSSVLVPPSFRAPLSPSIQRFPTAFFSLSSVPHPQAPSPQVERQGHRGPPPAPSIPIGQSPPTNLTRPHPLPLSLFPFSPFTLHPLSPPSAKGLCLGASP
jgi:hypothetical protein